MSGQNSTYLVANVVTILRGDNALHDSEMKEPSATRRAFVKSSKTLHNPQLTTSQAVMVQNAFLALSKKRFTIREAITYTDRYDKLL